VTVLVAAASRHGATEEIAQVIATTLGEHGVQAAVLRAEAVGRLDGYEAVVLGSAVYMGRWLEPAREVVNDHAAELAGLPTWLYSSGPIGDPPRPSAADAVDVGEIVAATRPREHRLFGGKLDRSLLGFGERAVMRAFRAPEGDFRDWDEIRGWAEEIAAALKR
jgi:menaquinone-dependent protoporphyrinogen oxidase